MRNSPTPSAGDPAAVRAPAPSWTLASSCTCSPDASRPGPFQARTVSRLFASAATNSRASASATPQRMVPVVPSTRMAVPSSTKPRSGVATMHGIPNCRAMIAVWLVGPPNWVTSPRILLGSSPAVSDGARSGASRMMGWSGCGTPGSGSPRISAMTRSRMSFRSVVRSAIKPPSFSNCETNLAMASAVAVVAGLPAPIWRVAVRIQPRSSASVAVAARTSLAAPVAAEALAAKRAATVSAAARKRSVSAARSSSAMMRVSTGTWGGLRAHPAGA